MQPSNPLLARIQIPGETVRLPSGGVLYTSNELSQGVTNGEIHIHPMTAIDEIIIKNPDKILSGKGVIEVIKRCIPDILEPEKLFAKDIDFILMCLRKITYGPDITVEQKHECENAKDHSYKFDINTFINTAKNIDPTTLDQLFKLTMPNKQVVNLKPMRFFNVIEMMSFAAKANDMEYEEIQLKLFNILTTMIDSVDEINDNQLIDQWLRAIPDPWVKMINKAIEKNSDWGIPVTQNVKCLDCGQDMEVVIDLNPISFFTVSSD